MLVPLDFWAAAALAFVIGQSKILGADFIPLRPLLRRWKWTRALVDCAFCLGFWCGYAVTGLQAIQHQSWPDPYQATIFALGCAAFSYLFDSVVSALERPALPPT